MAKDKKKKSTEWYNNENPDSRDIFLRSLGARMGKVENGWIETNASVAEVAAGQAVTNSTLGVIEDRLTEMAAGQKEINARTLPNKQETINNFFQAIAIVVAVLAVVLPLAYVWSQSMRDDTARVADKVDTLETETVAMLKDRFTDKDHDLYAIREKADEDAYRLYMDLRIVRLEDTAIQNKVDNAEIRGYLNAQAGLPPRGAIK